MALVRIPEENRTVEGEGSIAAYLAERGIDFERWTHVPEIGPGVQGDAVLAFYSEKIDQLKARGGYTTADVIDVTAETP